MSRGRGWLNRLADLFFPPKCVFCRRLLREGETGFCRGCRQKLPWAADPVFHGPFFDAGVAPLRYEAMARDSLLRYKFGGMYRYADVYGALLAVSIAAELEGPFDFVTWVPVSRKRKRRRGYDQAQLLAAAAAERLGLPLRAVLEKTIHTPPQSGLQEADQRRANVLGAYRATEDLSGCRILLIDDVVTTGATLSECAGVLRQSGAADVSCAALLQTVRGK